MSKKEKTTIEKNYLKMKDRSRNVLRKLSPENARLQGVYHKILGGDTVDPNQSQEDIFGY